jgi:plastocyanin
LKLRERGYSMKSVHINAIIAVLILGCVHYALAGNITGKIKAKGVKNSADAVIYIETVGDKAFPPPKDHPIMDQKNLKFVPHVLPIVAGTTVDFLNSDDVLHNVYTPDNCAEKFNLGSWPKGQKKSYTFKNQGCSPVLLCNVHPEMEGYIVTLQNPYFAVSDKDGSYAIKNVPAGKYTLKVWHQKLKGNSQEVTVKEAGDVEVNFEIKK